MKRVRSSFAVPTAVALRALISGLALSGVVAAAACCNQERTGVVVGPGLTVAPRSSAAATPDAGADADGVELVSPITATFIDLTAAGAPVRFRACEQVVIAVAKGKAHALSEDLGPGDLLLAQGTGGFDVKGEGLALLAAVMTRQCEPSTTPGIRKHVVRATKAPELTWADGKMHAHLDSDGEAASLAYVGRLAGTAAVGEHRHETSWEVLSAVEGAGTFTIDGKPNRLGPRQIVVVPPNVPHSWKPDDGANLVAIQMYSPAGPEQRFKALAASTTSLDAGPAPRDASAAPKKAPAPSK